LEDNEDYSNSFSLEFFEMPYNAFFAKLINCIFYEQNFRLGRCMSEVLNETFVHKMNNLLLTIAKEFVTPCYRILVAMSILKAPLRGRYKI
jgi:hypothetical protein